MGDVSVPFDFDQALVADPEVVGDLVEDNPSDLAAEPLGVVPIQTHEGAALDRDLVGQNAAVLTAALGERHTLIEAEESLAERRFLFDHDVDVRHLRTQIWRQRVERILGARRRARLKADERLAYLEL